MTTGGVDLAADLGSRPWGESYLVLGFRLANNLPRDVRKYFVDYYFGPDELRKYWADPRTRKGRVGPMKPDKCLHMAEELQRTIDVGDLLREAFLRDQLTGLATTARILRGDSVSYEDTIRLCYGIEPRMPDLGKLEETRESLREALGCSDTDMQAALDGWNERHRVPAERLQACLERTADEARQRTMDFIDLPEGERVTFEIVGNAEWGGYNWYHKGPGMEEKPLSSLVQVNAGVPTTFHSIVRLVAHEAYPGHHTDHAIKEARLYYKGEERHEASVSFYQTPELPVSEGIGDSAGRLIFPDTEEMLLWVNRNLLQEGDAMYDVEADARILESMKGLSGMRDLATYRLRIEGRSPEAAIEEAMRFSAVPRRTVENFVRGFASHQLFGPYAFNYRGGEKLVTEVMEAGGKPLVKRLYEEQHTPSTVRRFVLGQEG